MRNILFMRRFDLNLSHYQSDYSNRRLVVNKLKSALGYVSKMTANGIRTHVHNKQETYSGTEVAAILKRRTALTPQSPQFCWFRHVNIAYKNVNLWHSHSRYFDWHFCKLWNNCDYGRHIKRRALYRETERYLSHHQTSKHQCMLFGSVPILNSQESIPFSEGWKPPFKFYIEAFVPR